MCAGVFPRFQARVYTLAGEINCGSININAFCMLLSKHYLLTVDSNAAFYTYSCASVKYTIGNM